MQKRKYIIYFKVNWSFAYADQKEICLKIFLDKLSTEPNHFGEWLFISLPAIRFHILNTIYFVRQMNGSFDQIDGVPFPFPPITTIEEARQPICHPLRSFNIIQFHVYMMLSAMHVIF